jgi:hypothetical protein
MSHSVEVCIKYPGTLEELKAEVERVLGIELPHYESGSATLRSYHGKLLTIDLALSVNYLDTNRDMNFGDFQYVFSTRIAGHAYAHRLLELQLPLTDTIGLLLFNHLQAEVMVTIAVQELHARYHPDLLNQQTTG